MESPKYVIFEGEREAMSMSKCCAGPGGSHEDVGLEPHGAGGDRPDQQHCPEWADLFS